MNELKQNFSKSWHDMQTTSAWVLIFILTRMNIPCFSKTFWAELIATLVERTTHLSSSAVWKVICFLFPSSFDNWIWHLRRSISELLHNWAELGVDSKEGRGAVASAMKEQSHNTWTKRADQVQWQQRGSSQEFRSPAASLLMSQVLGQARESNLWVQDLWGTWPDTGIPVIWLGLKFSLGFSIAPKRREKVLNNACPNSCTTLSSQSYPRFHSCAVPELALSGQTRQSWGKSISSSSQCIQGADRDLVKYVKMYIFALKELFFVFSWEVK